MKSLSSLIILASVVMLVGCATSTITPDAQRVALHTQLSGVLSGCKKMGSVVSEVPLKGFASLLDDAIRNAKQQAINDLRDAAYKKYQADTVALVNVDTIGNSLSADKVVAHGLAYICN